jgi:glycerol-3-phosphate acyltransferase PlsY
MVLLYIILCLLLGYIIGSIPVALVLGKTFRGIDVREHGSHNLGATNAGRVLGRKYFFIVMILDAIKCGLGILIGYLLFLLFKKYDIDEYYTLGLSLAGTSAMIGHCYPIFADFRGGKGVATAAGYLILTTPLFSIFGFIIFVFIVLKKKYISLASITISILTILYTWIVYLIFKESYPFMGLNMELNLEYCIITTFFALTVIFKHKDNIHRLLNHCENKIRL